MNLLSAAGNSTGASVTLQSSGERYLSAYGTWSSATAKLQWSPNGGTTWIDVQDASFTADGVIRVIMPNGLVRGVVSGGGAGVSITMWLRS